MNIIFVWNYYPELIDASAQDIQLKGFWDPKFYPYFTERKPEAS